MTYYVLRLKIRCFLQFTYKNEVKTLALPYLEPWHIQTAAVSTEVNRRRRVTKWLYQISLVVCLGILESFCCLRTGRERISWLRRRRHIHGESFEQVVCIQNGESYTLMWTKNHTDIIIKANFVVPLNITKHSSFVGYFYLQNF